MVERRAFLQSLGGGLLVLLAAGGELPGQESGGGGHRRGGQQIPQDVAAWLHIAPDGTVTAFTGKVEVGQNARTSLTQAVADELCCAPQSVRLMMGDTDLTPWDMGTVGSRTTPMMAPQMRRMASTARETLLDKAAAQWAIDRTGLKFANGCVTNSRTGDSLKVGELAAAVDWTTVIGKDDAVTRAADWTVAGKSLPKVNAREIVSGKHKYTSDYKVPGMLFGRVLRQPSFGSILATVETSAASAMAGVTVVRDGDFLGVTAPNEHLAGKAIASIKATWHEKPQIAAKDLFAYLKAHAKESQAGAAIPAPSSVAPTLEASAKTLKSTYTVAYIAHVPLEPRAAVAEWKNGKLTVWTGTQRPFGVRSELAEALGMPESQVRVIVPDTGSGYGGKHTGECALEAARLAKAAGKPVKLIWTREEEFTWAYFRPAGVIDVSSGISHDGTLTAWLFENYLSGPSGLDTPYKVPGASIHHYPSDSPLRVGSYRGLAATANHFARESHMDELAMLAGMDPLAFRLKNLEDARLRAVLQAAAERFGWDPKKSATGHGFGLACGMEKGGYVACCTEISIAANKRVRIERVVEAWECGAVVNPEHLKNQVQGAIIQGLGGALFEAMDFANGRIVNNHLSKYRVPRFSDVPEIELVILDRKDLASVGAGETPIVAIAPAIANAICNASGVRVRSMPILPAFEAQQA